MRTPICDMLGIEFPLIAFTHCRDVVVEVSKAGGMGVLGAAGMSPQKLAQELEWIDDQIDGKPYGVDLIVPARFAGQKTQKAHNSNTTASIPETHKTFVRELMARHNIDTSDLNDAYMKRGTRLGDNMRDDGASALLEIAFAHPIKLIVNALGPPPPYMLERAKELGVPVGALIGTKEHALRQVAAGVDILIAAGGEAGGHCGEISTLVLVPEVVDAVGDIPVLAAGGIVTGRQMAACMAMGAAGAWTGSVWLTTAEAETSPVVKQKMLEATSRDTLRSKARTGKHSRQLRSAWTDAWESPDAPEPLPMPLQSIVTEPAMRKINKLAEGGHDGAKELASYFVGQGVGLMNHAQSTRSVVYEFMEDFVKANERLQGYLQD
jgi:NAD(P)H-dependent flavin oxidoreductase YrpB (nitropropane dioxygenase family)